MQPEQSSIHHLAWVMKINAHPDSEPGTLIISSWGLSRKSVLAVIQILGMKECDVNTVRPWGNETFCPAWVVNQKQSSCSREAVRNDGSGCLCRLKKICQVNSGCFLLCPSQNVAGIVVFLPAKKKVTRPDVHRCSPAPLLLSLPSHLCHDASSLASPLPPSPGPSYLVLWNEVSSSPKVHMSKP